jgi:hypothetical protein
MPAHTGVEPRAVNDPRAACPPPANRRRIMFLRRRLAAFAAVIAALAAAAPVQLASATTSAATDPVVTGPSCPDGYKGPTNLATGCPYWLMSYTVQYKGQAPLRCPVRWNQAGSAGRVAHGCDAVATGG